MGAISKFEMTVILGSLDSAMASTRATDIKGHEGNATWSIRMARQRLLDAAISPIAVEQREAA